MANQMIPIEQSQPSKLMRQRMASGVSLAGNFADNIGDSFPRLSIKGSKFHVRLDGQDITLMNPDNPRLPLQDLDVVFVNASNNLAKTYYEKGFSDGDMNQPDCWSLDSIRPDPSVVNKINPTCLDCPFNAFGSRITPDGKEAKMCSDSRRVAVVMPHEILTPEPHIFLLRVPQGSLKNLKNYTMDKLARFGYEPGGCISRLTFNAKLAYPKVEFDFVSPLTDEEFAVIIKLAESQYVASMLKAPDFDKAASGINMVPSQEVEVRPQPNQRQKAPVFAGGGGGGGFGPGQLDEQAKPQRSGPTLDLKAEPEEQEEEMWEELPDNGGWISLTTGEIRPAEEAAAEPQIDPAVIKTQDGRFYSRTIKAFVASQFVGAEKVPAVPPAKQAAQAEPAKKPARQRKAAPKVEEPAAEQPQQEAQAEADEPVESKPKPKVTAASPKLEALISGLRNNTPSGNA